MIIGDLGWSKLKKKERERGQIFSGPCCFFIMILLVRVSITAVKCHDQNQLEKERIISVHSSYSIIQGSQGRNSEWERGAELMLRPWRSAAYCLACSWLALLASSSHPGELPHQSPIKKTLWCLTTGQSGGHIFSIVVLSSQKTLACTKLTLKS